MTNEQKMKDALITAREVLLLEGYPEDNMAVVKIESVLALPPAAYCATKQELDELAKSMPVGAIIAVGDQPAAVVELTDQEIAESIMGANSWPNNLLPTYLSIQAVRAVIAAHIAKQGGAA